MRILSIDGGGYLGLATAVFLRELERFYDTTCHSRFDLFCGTSTGSIIALGLASGMSAEDIVTFYRGMGEKVFPRTWRQRVRALPGVQQLCDLFSPTYAIEPLQAVLRDAFHDKTLGDLNSAKKFALVTAYSVSKGYPTIFKTDHDPKYNLHDGLLLADVAMASAAAPLYFPLARLRAPNSTSDEFFCDGGVVANHPALLGFMEALHIFKARPETISLLSVSTPRMELAEGGLQRPSRGLLGWKPTLASLMIDGSAHLTHEVLRRLVDSYGVSKPRYQRVRLRNPNRLPFDRADPEATQELEHLGAREGTSTDTRNNLEPFFI